MPFGPREVLIRLATVLAAKMLAYIKQLINDPLMEFPAAINDSFGS
jgi:hypothetical protein